MDKLLDYFKQALNSVIHNYVNFSGRATRTEFFSVLISLFVLYILAAVLLILPVLGIIIFAAYTLAIILPLLSVTARRLHDVNKPAWFILVPFGLGLLAFIIAANAYATMSFSLLAGCHIIAAIATLFNAYVAYLIVLPSDPNSTYGTADNLKAPLKLELVDALKKVYLKNYLNFNGRAGRAEFWWPVYFFTFIYASLVNFLNIIPFLGTIISIIVMLAVILPNIALAVRRMHDINKSGFYVLIPYAGLAIFVYSYVNAFSNFYYDTYGAGLKILFGTVIAFASIIYFVVLALRKGDQTENRFGPAPDEVVTEENSSTTSNASVEALSNNSDKQE